MPVAGGAARRGATRRGLLALGMLTLGGCGFRPLYGSSSQQAGLPVGEALADINVELIGERPGQLLRQALQARFYGAGNERPRVMNLKVVFGIAAEGLGIQQDNSSTRTRLVGSSAWTLTASDPKLGTLASGTARAIDGYNVFDQQYFASDLANDAAQRRIAEAVADRITQQIATYLARKARAAA